MTFSADGNDVIGDDFCPICGFIAEGGGNESEGDNTSPLCLGGCGAGDEFKGVDVGTASGKESDGDKTSPLFRIV